MPNTAIKVNHLTKIYKLYDKPIDRLKESLHPLKKQYHKDFYALNDVSFEIEKGETVAIIDKSSLHVNPFIIHSSKLRPHFADLLYCNI